MCLIWPQSATAATPPAHTAGLAIEAPFVAVLAVGGARVATGAIEVGTLVVFLAYLYHLMPPIQVLVGAVTHHDVGAAAIDRIQESRSHFRSEPDGAPAGLSSPPKSAGTARAA